MSEKGIEITMRNVDKCTVISQRGVEIRHEGRPVRMEFVIGYVYLVVDCSGSMEGYKLNQAKEGALKFAKDALVKGYLTGLIQFNSSTVHLCEPQSEISVLDQYLKKMEAGGGTNMAEAICLAHERLKDRAKVRVIVIVTDGMPDSIEASLRAGENAKKDSIDIITIGTDDADQVFLKKLASRTELGIKVSREQLKSSIASTAMILPQLERGEKGG